MSSRYLYYFAIIPIRSICTMWLNYQVTEKLGTAFKLRQRMKTLLSCAHVLHKTLSLVISRCCLAEHGEEMSQNLKASVEPLSFSLNPITVWRSRCRRRSSFLNSLIGTFSNGDDDGRRAKTSLLK